MVLRTRSRAQGSLAHKKYIQKSKHELLQRCVLGSRLLSVLVVDPFQRSVVLCRGSKELH